MRWPVVVLQLLVAAFAIVNVIGFRLQNLMVESAGRLDQLALLALAAIVVLTAAGVAVIVRVRPTPTRVMLATVLAVTAVGVSFAPAAMETRHRDADAAARAAAASDRASERRAERDRWTDEVRQRRATSRRFSPVESWAFIDAVSAAQYDDAVRDAPDRQALDLLQQALGAGLIDVNAPLAGHFRDTRERPLFLVFYGERIAPLRNALARQDWQIMRLLAGNGADLAQPDAQELVVDLRKTAVAGPSRFVVLQAPP